MELLLESSLQTRPNRVRRVQSKGLSLPMWITVRIRSVLLLSATLIVLCTFVACERAAPLDKAQPMSPIVQRLLQEGDEALKRHDFERAFALADSAAVRAPGLADIPFFRGRIYTELAQSHEADTAYRKALAIRPTYPGGWNNLGNTAFRGRSGV